MRKLGSVPIYYNSPARFLLAHYAFTIDNPLATQAQLREAGKIFNQLKRQYHIPLTSLDTRVYRAVIGIQPAMSLAPKATLTPPQAPLSTSPPQNTRQRQQSGALFTAADWMRRIANATTLPTDPIKIWLAADKARKGDWEGGVALLAGALPAFFERLPDYITVNGTLPVGTPFTGWSGTVTLDIRNKKFNLSPAGGGIAYPSMLGASITAGWYGTFSKETAQKKLPNFLAQHGLNVQIAYGLAGGVSHGFPGTAVEAGIGTPGISLTYNYTWSWDQVKKFFTQPPGQSSTERPSSPVGLTPSGGFPWTPLRVK